MTTEMFQAAIEYVEKHGFSVIPLVPNGKQPAVKWLDFQKRKPTLEELEEWFAETDHNIGIVLGEVSGLAGVDDDLYQYQGNEVDLSSIVTPTVRTGKTEESFHRYFAYREGLRRYDITTGQIFKGSGHYFVAPPSIHPDGGGYHWTLDLTTPLAEVPDIFVEKPRLFKEGSGYGLELPEVITAGDRHDTLVRAAGAMRRYGLGEAAILAALVEVNAEHCRPPKSQHDLEVIARSAMNWEPEEALIDPGEAVLPAEDGEDDEMHTLEEVLLQSRDFLMTNIFPMELVLMTGPEGDGKTTAAKSLAALTTRGLAPGDITEPRSVLITSSEEDEGSILGTLRAADGDTSLVRVVDDRSGDGQWLAAWLDRHITRLETQTGVACGLVIIDGIKDFASVDTEDHIDKDVRAFLSPLMKMANRRQVCVICTLHPKKGEEKGISGSRGWRTKPRTVLTFRQGKDITVEKSNHGKKNKTVAITGREAVIGTDPRTGKDITAWWTEFSPVSGDAPFAVKEGWERVYAMRAARERGGQ